MKKVQFLQGFKSQKVQFLHIFTNLTRPTLCLSLRDIIIEYIYYYG